ncbi:MAG: oligosaccharide flippase family protein [Bacteroidaceae bacterium]|nr:oligosaccharide flippase family protein [Bacteroidaceae bacterium]
MNIGKYKQVIENFFSLSVLNTVNIVLQLVTLPYILGVVGKENYGIYSYVFMVVQYIILFSTYGFNYSATKQVSQQRDDNAAVTRIYNAVIGCKTIIALVLVAAVVVCSKWVFEEQIGYMMFLLGTGMILGDIMNPVWLFQGMEKMKYMTLVNSTSKILFTVLVFFVVRSVDDFYLLILLNSCGYLLAGILSLVLARRQFKVRLAFPRVNDIIAQFKDGGAMFGSTFGMNLYRNAHVIILKHFASNEAVGLFSAAEKVIHGFQSVILPAAQALFPHVSLRFKDKSYAENVALMKKVLLPFVGLAFVTTLFVYIFAPWISDVLCGKDFSACIPLIRIMSLVIIFGEINYIAGIVGLVNMNRQNYFFRSVLITGVVSCLITLALVGSCEAYAGAISLAASEALLMVMCLYGLLNKKKIK